MRFKANTIEALKLELDREFDRLNSPGEPKPVFHCTTANRPDAADYPFCVIFNETTGAIEASDGASWV